MTRAETKRTILFGGRPGGGRAEELKKRDIIEDIRWGHRAVKMRSVDNGSTYLGDSGVPGLILVARRGATGYVMRLEDRKTGNSWASEPKRGMNMAAANLRRQLIRVAGSVIMGV